MVACVGRVAYRRAGDLAGQRSSAQLGAKEFFAHSISAITPNRLARPEDIYDRSLRLRARFFGEKVYLGRQNTAKSAVG